MKKEKYILPELLVRKVESILTLSLDLGLLTQVELGIFMRKAVCPVCPTKDAVVVGAKRIKCPVTKVYELMITGAGYDELKKVVEDAAKKMGLDLNEFNEALLEKLGKEIGAKAKVKTTPTFLKIGGLE